MSCLVSCLMNTLRPTTWIKGDVTLVEPIDAMKCDWMNAKVVGTPSILSTREAINAAGIMVENSLE